MDNNDRYIVEGLREALDVVSLGGLNNPNIREIMEFKQYLEIHSATVEFYLNRLSICVPDGQHPHDLAGPGNKLEWGVLQGLALQEKDTPEKQKIFENSLRIHRQEQKHHFYWDSVKGINIDERRYGAIDAVVSLREPRVYQGGIHTWEQIEGLIEKNPAYRHEAMLWALLRIRNLEETGKGFSQYSPELSLGECVQKLFSELGLSYLHC